MREAGLVISSDLCPVTPGSCTRLSTSLQIITCNRLGQSLISLLEPDYPSLALAVWRGLRTLSDGVMAPPLAVHPLTNVRPCGRSAGVELITPMHAQLTAATSVILNVVLVRGHVKRNRGGSGIRLTASVQFLRPRGTEDGELSTFIRERSHAHLYFPR
jgi:hypothetical protein